MKRLLFFLMFTFVIGVAAKAQDDKDKIKKTSTPTQKAHNLVSHHKKYSGYKVKRHHGKTHHKRKVSNNGEVKEKTDK